MRFKDRLVVVTGGARGIGLACAREFALEGARIACLDVDDSAKPAMALIGPAADAWHCDMSRFDEVSATFNDVVKALGCDICFDQ